MWLATTLWNPKTYAIDDLGRILPFTQRFEVHLESIVGVKPPHDFAAELDVRFLVFAHRYDQLHVGFTVHDDIRRLQHRIAEETVCMQIFVGDVFERFFVCGHALKPTERSNHGEQQIQFGMLGNCRLHE